MILMRRIFPLATLLLSLGWGAHASDAQERWVVYYANKQPVAKFMDYDVIALDSDDHVPLEKLKDAHKTVLGYLSLGEGEDFRTAYRFLVAKKLLLGNDEAWKGHRIIDIRHPEWADYVNATLIPKILDDGFDGIVIDSLESATDLEEQHPEKYKDMKQAAINLVKLIRAHYPHMKIMVNRTFSILPEIAHDIDMVLAEGTYTDWQPDESPSVLPQKKRQHFLDMIAAARKQNPGLKIYTLDYWPQSDKEFIKQIYAKQRESGFIPYVSTLGLDHIYPEPE